MAEEETKETKETAEITPAAAPIVPAGKVSQWLTQNGFVDHLTLATDNLGVEVIRVEPQFLLPVATALYAYGFNYMQCQGGYDVGAGDELVSFYHLIKMSDNADRPEEIRVKVFLPRENPVLPSVYWIWRTADWQERETFDMYGIVYQGHPNLKRVLMPEDWVGYPLRKDYVSPDFYELQDAH